MFLYVFLTKKNALFNQLFIQNQQQNTYTQYQNDTRKKKKILISQIIICPNLDKKNELKATK